jgi:hypothetical protein
MRAVAPCGRECEGITFKLRHNDMPVELILKGNTYFFVNDQLPPDLAALRIDRLVHEVVLPL